MRLFRLPALALVLLVGGFVSLNLNAAALSSQRREAAQGGKDDLTTQELKKLQGTWLLVGRERGGEKDPEEKVQAMKGRLTVKGGNFAFKIGDLNFTGTVTLDPSKSPKQLDISFVTASGEKGKAVGIYELQGDTFRECFDAAGKERPRQFKTRPGSDQVLQTFRREKK
jgi:uncharacterized protein (TIGR03067 family)